jgi:hypothetical protein
LVPHRAVYEINILSPELRNSGANFRLVKEMLRAPALERMRRHRERFADDVIERWADPEAHAGIRRYVADVLGK